MAVINSINFDQLNHTFTNVFTSDGIGHDIGFRICEICNIKVWVGNEAFWIFTNFEWKVLDITCEEMQIKNILE